MSNTILCLSETPYLNNKNPLFTNDSPSKATTQDENNYVKDVKTDGPSSKQNSSRKREASNILMECVKRRDNLRNIDSTSNVPCDFNSSDSIHCGLTTTETFLRTENGRLWDLSKGFCDEEVLGNADLSDSSVADSGIECSKSNSPVHSVETSR